MASTNKTDFASDPRMTLNEQTGKWSYVGEEGVSYEYDENVGAWFPMVSLYLQPQMNMLLMQLTVRRKTHASTSICVCN